MRYIPTRFSLLALVMLVLLALGGAGAKAQQQTYFPTVTGGYVPGAAIMCANAANLMAPCGSASNPLQISGSFSATLSGFNPLTAGTPITATTGGATQTLPAGTVVVATNVGATNAAYCALGGSSSTAQQYIAPNGGWFAFTVGGATQLTCVTSTSTTAVNTVGGSGLPTGTGGGGGSGGGGGNVNLTQVGGSSIAIGSAVSAASLPVVIASDQAAVAVKQTTAANLNATVVGTGTFTVQAQESGTWNITNVSGTVSLPTGAATSAKQPALGTAGTASTDVITVQGIASMTPLLATNNLTQQAGTNLGSPAAYGTPPTGDALSVNAFVTNMQAAGAQTTAASTSITVATDQGWTPVYKSVSALGSAAAVAVKASAGQLGFANCDNQNTSPVYIQVFNVAQGSVTIGTTAPNQVIPIPAAATSGLNAGGFALSRGSGLIYGTAITVAETTTATGNTAPSTVASCTFGYN